MSQQAEQRGKRRKPAKKSAEHSESKAGDDAPPREIGGRDGPDPTRYGDWEKNGRCIDF
ncbi:MAG: DUF1674 domain-containing protein [Woeseiaceae bacterium]|nr:DUF1674 domain-containing protein [Woeseiaceae bacterium]